MSAFNNGHTKNGKTVQHVLVLMGQTENIQTLMKNVVELFGENTLKELLMKCTKFGQNIIQLCAFDGNAEILDVLLVEVQ